MDVRSWLDRARACLAGAGIEEHPRREARALLAAASGWSALAVLAESDRPLPRDVEARAEALLARRARREPLAYVLGHVTWRGLDLRVDRRCLVPRPETEDLVTWALSALEVAATGLVIDVGTGSGCLLAAVLSERPRCRGVALDLSSGALQVARANLTRHVPGGTWLALQTASLSALAPGSWTPTVVLANPPYVTESEWRATAPEVRDHEPRLALVVPDEAPLAPYEHLLAGLARWPRLPCLGLEVGSGRADAVRALVRGAGYHGVEVRADFAGVDRFVLATSSP